MTRTQFKRRLAGMVHARLPEARLEAVPDPRDRRGRRWALATLLTVVVVGVLAGCRCLAELEQLTGEMSDAMRKLLGFRRRVADTTLRDALVLLEPTGLRACLHAQVRSAYRRKSLKPEGIPFGVLAIDGKVNAIDGSDLEYAQRQVKSSGEEFGLLRTLTCSLVSARAKVCVDAVPIPPKTNEMGHFPVALD